jgi:hypothetical protein
MFLSELNELDGLLSGRRKSALSRRWEQLGMMSDVSDDDSRGRIAPIAVADVRYHGNESEQRDTRARRPELRRGKAYPKA